MFKYRWSLLFWFVILTSFPNNKTIQWRDFFLKTTITSCDVGMFLNVPQQRLQYNNEGLTVFRFLLWRVVRKKRFNGYRTTFSLLKNNVRRGNRLIIDKQAYVFYLCLSVNSFQQFNLKLYSLLPLTQPTPALSQPACVSETGSI